MTDREVTELKRGDAVYEDATCRRFTCTTDARPSKSRTHYEAWAISASGKLVAVVNYSSGFHTAAIHKEHER